MKKIISIVTFSLIFICGFALCGCGGSKGALSISLNQKAIELLITDESKEFIIEVKNYSASPSFDFNFETPIAKIVENSVTKVSDGKYSFSIAPLVSGKTTLVISLRGTNASVIANLTVTDEISQITAKPNLYLVKGQSLQITSNSFNFVPENNLNKQISLQIKSGQELDRVELNQNVLTAPEDSTSNQVVLIATSEQNSNVFTEFSVKLVSDIDISSLNVGYLNQDSVNPELFDEGAKQEAFKINPDTNKQEINTITLIRNNKTQFQKRVLVEYNFQNLTDNYKIDVNVSSGIVGDVSQDSPLTATKNFAFNIQADEATMAGQQFEIKFIIYRADFEFFTKDITIPVYAINTPSEIRVNGQTEIQTIELFDNYKNTNTYNFTILPSLAGAYNENYYKYSISAYSAPIDDKNSLTALDLDQLKEFADVAYNNKNLADFTGGEGDNLQELANLNASLTVKPNKKTDGYLVLKIECLDQENNCVVQRLLHFVIYKGTTTFDFAESIVEKDRTLYVSIADGAKQYSQFSYDEGSTVGELIITPKQIGETVCNVQYVSDVTDADGETVPAISINPKKVGESEFYVRTLNGIERLFKVVVVREITKDDFTLVLDGSKQSQISSFEMDASTQSIKRLVIKGLNSSAYVTPKILTVEDANLNSYEFGLLSSSANIQIENNSKITAVNNFVTNAEITVKLAIFWVDSFMLKRPANTEDFTFKVSSIDYIKSMDLYVGEAEGELFKSKDVYNYGDLPYTQKGLADAHLYLNLTMSSSENTLKIKQNSFSVSVATIDADGKVGNFGTIEFVKDAHDFIDLSNLTNHIAKFTCSTTGIVTISAFEITLTAEDDAGATFRSSVTINLKKYIDVDSLYLTNATSEIYLDSTISNQKVTLTTYVMPSNAMNHDIEVVYSDCVSVNIQGNVVEILAVRAGVGQIKIYPISRIKEGKETNPDWQNYYHISIKVTVADGLTEATALKLSTYQDLINMNANLHYFVDQIIDCKGQVINIASFNKTLRGTSESANYFGEDPAYDPQAFMEDEQLGGITNFVIGGYGINAGLFGELGASAVIYNLYVSGSLSAGVSTKENIGILCGTNKGKIYDVLVECEEVPSLEGNVSAVNIGFVAGLNEGEIKTTQKAKNSTLMVNATNPKTLALSNYHDQDVYVGVVAGKNTNTGKIISEYVNAGVIIGLFGTTTNIKLTTNAKYFGGVVGFNSGGTITGLKVTGEIVNSARLTYIGGIAGKSDGGEISQNIVRPFIRGYGTVAGLVAEVISPNITNNIIHATDDGTRIGLNASLIVAYYASANPQNKVYATFEGDDSAYNNDTKTYFSRTYTSIGVGDVANTSLEKTSYYGDVLLVEMATGAELYIKRQEQFDVVEASGLTATYTTFAMAIFKQALLTSQSQYVNNKVNTQNIFKVAGLVPTEVNIKLSSNNVANIINFGKELNLLNKGMVQITLTSALNYSKQLVLNVYITNEYKQIKSYANTDHSIEVSSVSLINRGNTQVYLNAEVDLYNFQNTPIQLVSNTDIEFDYIKESLSGVNVTVIGQNISLNATNNSEESGTIKLYEKLLINGTYYFGKFNDEIGAHVFNLLSKDEDAFAVQIGVTSTTGIQNISFAKQSYNAEPTDEIEIVVTYESFNTLDKLNSTITFTHESILYNNVELNVNPGDSFGTFVADSKNLFTLSWQEPEIDGNHYKVVYTLIMCHENEDVYKMLKNSQITLTFTAEKTNIFNHVTINYSSETISAVLLNNYNYEENEGMIVAGPNLYNPNNMVNSSVYSSTGDYNIIKAFVYTSVSEFEYLEVVLNTATKGGYLGLINKDGNLDVNVIYTSIGSEVKIKIYKNILTEIVETSAGNLLPITIAYSLSVLAPDNERATITFNFYKDEDTLCFTKDIQVIAKNAKKVEFTINGKEPLAERDAVAEQTYQVAKGKKYLLDTNVVGFKDDEIYFESSAPNYANVSYEGGAYFLNVSNSIYNYEEDLGADDYKPYNRVLIYAYGERDEANGLVRSRVQTTALNIYEFLLNDNLFITNALDLRVLSTANIKDEVSNLIGFEQEQNISKVNTFINSFKNSATFTFSSNNIDYQLSETTKIITSNYELNGFNIKPLVVTDVAPYTITVQYRYCYHKGVPTCDADIINQTSEKVFVGRIVFNVHVYMNSSGDLPLPIYNYQDLLKVQNDEYYRLVSNITIPSAEFTTITKTPLGLDGNGYSIIINAGDLGVNVENVSNFAIFETIQRDAVFKNINIVFNSGNSTQINNQGSSSGVNVGILCAINNGTVTNCSITAANAFNLNIVTNSQAMDSSNFGAICAINNGYISHSRVMANISVGGASVAGLVSINKGKIASSYVKNCRIANTTSTPSLSILTGGLVCVNSGTISTSFVEGATNLSTIYCNYSKGNYGLTSKIIYTASAVGGFVYVNSGLILDCYSNIPVVSSTKAGGFVGINNGTIKRAISLSKLKENDILNYGFVIEKGEDAIFEDCFFVFERNKINYKTSETNYKPNDPNDTEERNVESVIAGVTPLKPEQFDVSNVSNASIFKNFSYEGANGIGGIWFYAEDLLSNNANNPTYLVNLSSMQIYDVETKIYKEQSFNAKRLQLVSPNQISTSRSILAQNGDEYVYSTVDPNVDYGSRNNPYLVSNAIEFEEYFSTASSKLRYFRIIKDINYSNDKVYTSALSRTTAIVNVEGNNFIVENYTVNSGTTSTSAGLLGTIGRGNSYGSLVKNLTFKPKYVNAPNSTFVGAIAGTLSNASVYNVHVDAPTVIVLGRNIVGGMFGRINETSKLEDVSANITARSDYYDINIKKEYGNIETLNRTAIYNEKGTNQNFVSYSGAIVGYVAGTSVVTRASVGSSAKSFGAISGLAFGGIGSLATFENSTFNLNSYNNQIKARLYGGIVVGEQKGTVNNIEINSIILNKNLFSLEPIITLCVGGVVGMLNGGTISNLTTTNGYNVVGAGFTGNYELKGTDLIPVINDPYVSKYVGGIAGYVTQGTITSAELGNGNGLLICGGTYVGGIAGYVEDKITIEEVDLLLTSKIEYVNQEGEEITETLYTSYVSEASINKVDYLLFNNCKQNFGLMVGYADTTEIEMSGENITINGKLYVYYADYNIEAKGSSYESKGLEYNLTKYLVGETTEYADDADHPKINIILKNLATGAIVFPK